MQTEYKSNSPQHEAKSQTQVSKLKNLLPTFPTCRDVGVPPQGTWPRDAFQACQRQFNEKTGNTNLPDVLQRCQLQNLRQNVQRRAQKTPKLLTTALKIQGDLGDEKGDKGNRITGAPETEPVLAAGRWVPLGSPSFILAGGGFRLFAALGKCRGKEMTLPDSYIKTDFQRRLPTYTDTIEINNSQSSIIMRKNA